MPLPVERSQGSVSALVARFQIAADRDKEAATAREKDSAISLSRRTSLNPQSRRASGISPSPSHTPKLDDSSTTTVGLGVGVANGGGTQNIDKPVNGDGKEKEALNYTKPTTPPTKTKAMTSSPSPARPPKSPARQSSAVFMSPSNPPSPTASFTPAPPLDPTTKDEKKSNPTVVASTTRSSKSTTASTSKPASSGDKINPPSTAKKTFPKTTSTTNTSTAPTAPNANGEAGTKPRPRVTSSLSSTQTPRTARPASVATTTRTPRTSTGTGAGAGAGSSISSRRTSASRSGNANATSTPSSGTAVLTPNMTGPTPRHEHRRPSSAFSPSPSPLKPHLTGTPSKPTASYLAKTRTPPASTSAEKNAKSLTATATASSTTGSLGRKFSPAVSVGGRFESKSPSHSPVSLKSTITAEEGTPSSKTTISNSASTSRLMQGTAASRARAAAANPHSHPSSPTAHKTTRSNTTPSKPGSSSSKPRTSTSLVSDQEPMKGVGRSPIRRLGLTAAGMKKPLGPNTQKGEKISTTTSQDKEEKGEAPLLAPEPTLAATLENGEKESLPIQRPVTPPPPQAELEPRDELQSHTQFANEQEQEQEHHSVPEESPLPAAHDDMEDKGQEVEEKNSDAAHDGEASELEEIPDLE